MARRCFWPPERRAALEPTGVEKPSLGDVSIGGWIGGVVGNGCGGQGRG